jgi:polar amino acid transport system substrate-binding protein
MKTKIYHWMLVLLTTFSLSMSACGASSVTQPTPTPHTATIPVTIYSDDSYPPYSYQENGEAKGIYVEILKTAFSRMKGYTVTIKPVLWKRGLGYIETGIGFGIFPPYYRPDIRPWMDVSVPILDESLVFFCNADTLTTPRPNWPQDYAGLKIAHNQGFSTFKETVDELAKYNITIVNAVGSETNLIKLANRQVDCYDNDRLSILWQLQRLKAKGAYKPGSTQAEIVEATVISSEKGYLGYTNTDKGAFAYKEDFKAQLDKILADMKESGEIQKIVDQFINQQ